MTAAEVDLARGELEAGCAALGVDVSGDALSRMVEFLMLLSEWNKKMNLTAIKDVRGMVTVHLLDSLSCLLFDRLWNPGSTVVDVGTGAGFPGIPLLLARPELSVTFMDSTAKKLVFVREACDRLGLQAKFVHSRAEDAGRIPEHRASYGIAVSRAVARLDVLAELCLPLVTTGGFFLAMKGPSVDEEMPQGLKAAVKLGGSLTQDRSLRLPDGEARRLLLFEKTNQTPQAYPLKSGVIGKRPLA